MPTKDEKEVESVDACQTMFREGKIPAVCQLAIKLTTEHAIGAVRSQIEGLISTVTQWTVTAQLLMQRVDSAIADLKDVSTIVRGERGDNGLVSRVARAETILRELGEGAIASRVTKTETSLNSIESRMTWLLGVLTVLMLGVISSVGVLVWTHVTTGKPVIP